MGNSNTTLQRDSMEAEDENTLRWDADFTREEEEEQREARVDQLLFDKARELLRCVVKDPSDRTNNDIIVVSRDLNKAFEKIMENSTKKRFLSQYAGKRGFASSAVNYIRKLQDMRKCSNLVEMGNEPDDRSNAYLDIALAVRTWVWNFSDSSETVQLVLGKSGYIQDLLQEIQVIVDGGYREGNKCEEQLQSALGILQNCSKHQRNRRHFDGAGIMSDLAFLVKSHREEICVLAVLTMCNIEKDGKDFLVRNKEYLRILVEYFERTIERRTYFSLHEICTALCELISAKGNQATLVECGVLRPVMRLLNVGTQEEKLSATQILWHLSFDETSRRKILDTTDAISNMRHFKEKEDGELQEAAEYVLWQVLDTDAAGASEHSDEDDDDDDQGEEHDYQEDNVKGRGATGKGRRAFWAARRRPRPRSCWVAAQRAAAARNRPKPQNKEGDQIMISYCHIQQPVMRKVRDALQQRGYNVWMDIDRAGGSLLKMMAKAVEESTVIIVGMSLDYFKSQPCHSEAEYAYKCEKQFLFTKLKTNYEPRGWLGLILGNNYYYDLTEEEEFDTKIEEMVRRLREMKQHAVHSKRYMDQHVLLCCTIRTLRTGNTVKRFYASKRRDGYR